MTRKKFFRVCLRIVRNLFRLIFGLMVVFVFFTLVIWFLALKYLSAGQLGSELAAVLQKSLNRPVIIGAIKLTDINEVQIDGLKVVDTSVPNGYGDLISASSTVIRYDLPALLEGRVRIKEIILKNPSLNLIKYEGGRSNLPQVQTLGEASTAEGQVFSVAAGARNIDVIIEDWKVENGTLSYRDFASNASHSLNGVFVQFENLKFNQASDYALNFVLRNKIKDRILETEIYSRGKINLADFAPANMTLEGAKVEVRGLKQPLSFNVSAQNFANPNVDIESRLPALGYDDVSLLLPKQLNFNLPAAALRAGVQFSDGFKKIKVKSARFSNEHLTLNAKADFDFSAPQNHGLIQFKAEDFDAANIDYFGVLKDYKLAGPISAAGEAVLNEGKLSLPKLALDLKGVDGFVTNFTITGARGQLNINDNLNEWDATVQDGVFKVGRQTVSAVRGDAQYSHRKKVFNALVARGTKFNAKDIKLDVTITDVTDEPKRSVRVMLYTNKFEPLEVFDTVQDFVAALSDGDDAFTPEEGDLAWLHNFKKGIPKFMPNFNGFIFADEFYSPIISGKNFNAEFNLKALLPQMPRLSGRVDITLQNGTIYQLQEAAERQKALGIAFQPFVLMNNMERAGSFKMGQVLKDTPFETMSASVDITNGKMTVNNFFANGEVIAAALSGSVDWTAESMDIDIATMFKNTSKRGVLSENLTDESGDPALSFNVSGPMSKPAVHVKSPKKVGAAIREATIKGIRTNFSAGQYFMRGDNTANAKKTAN